MSTEETRYYLNGLYFHAAETDGSTVLRIVATDGHRLARVEVALPKWGGRYAWRNSSAQGCWRNLQVNRRS